MTQKEAEKLVKRFTEWGDADGCKKHPGYRGLGRPRLPCPVCWAIYMNIFGSPDLRYVADIGTLIEQAKKGGE